MSAGSWLLCVKVLAQDPRCLVFSLWDRMEWLLGGWRVSRFKGGGWIKCFETTVLILKDWVLARCITVHPAEFLHVLTAQPLTLICFSVLQRASLPPLVLVPKPFVFPDGFPCDPCCTCSTISHHVWAPTVSVGYASSLYLHPAQTVLQHWLLNH